MSTNLFEPPQAEKQGRRGPKRKKGPRTPSGWLSQAYKRNAEVRDNGTPEVVAKRRALVGADGEPILAESVLGCLVAHGHLDRTQYDEGLRFRYLYGVRYGVPFSCTVADAGGSTLSDKRLQELETEFKDKLALLTKQEEQAFRNVCACNCWPNCFFVEKQRSTALPEGRRLMLLPEDKAEKEALISGLNALLGRSGKGSVDST